MEAFQFYFSPMGIVTTSMSAARIQRFSECVLCLENVILLFKKILIVIITVHASSADVSNSPKSRSLLSKLQSRAQEHFSFNTDMDHAIFLYLNSDSWRRVQSMQMRKSAK